MSDNVHMATLPIWRGRPADGTGTVGILVHGRTLNPEYMFQQIAKLSLDERYAWCALSAAGNSWYPAKFMDPIEQNQPSLDQALECVASAVTAAESLGYSREQIALIGFSQGACLLSEFVYRNPGPWHSLIAWTGGLIGPPETTWRPTADALKGVPILLTNGDNDPWVPMTRSRQTADVFRQMGARVSEHVFPGREHGIIFQELSLAQPILLG